MHNVGEHISLFVAGVKDKVALKLIVAKGKIQMQAQADNIEVTAAKDIAETANEKIVINAGKEILLASGGGYIRISGGNIEIHAPGPIDIKGASHSLGGPTWKGWQPPEMPHSDLHSHQFEVKSPETGLPQAQVPYFVRTEEGKVYFGETDKSGMTQRIHSASPKKLQIFYGYEAIQKIDEHKS